MARNIKAIEYAENYRITFDDMPSDPAKIERLRIEIMKLENTQRIFSQLLESFLDHTHARNGDVIMPLKKMQPILQHLKQLQLRSAFDLPPTEIAVAAPKKPWWMQLTDRLKRSG
jgi:hypothetical protein